MSRKYDTGPDGQDELFPYHGRPGDRRKRANREHRKAIQGRNAQYNARRDKCLEVNRVAHDGVLTCEWPGCPHTERNFPNFQVDHIEYSEYGQEPDGALQVLCGPHHMLKSGVFRTSEPENYRDRKLG